MVCFKVQLKAILAERALLNAHYASTIDDYVDCGYVGPACERGSCISNRLLTGKIGLKTAIVYIGEGSLEVFDGFLNFASVSTNDYEHRGRLGGLMSSFVSWIGMTGSSISHTKA